MEDNRPVPVVIVGDHHHAAKAIHLAIRRGRLDPEGVTMVHIDSHPDMVPPSCPVGDLRDPQTLYDALDHDVSGIAAWILPLAATGHVGAVHFIHPPWTTALATWAGETVELGEGATTGRLATTSTDPYFVVSEATDSLRSDAPRVRLALRASPLLDPDTASLCPGGDPLPARRLVLDICLDAFSTQCPFRTALASTPPAAVDALARLFAPPPLPACPEAANRALQASRRGARFVLRAAYAALAREAGAGAACTAGADADADTATRAQAPAVDEALQGSGGVSPEDPEPPICPHSDAGAFSAAPAATVPPAVLREAATSLRFAAPGGIAAYAGDAAAVARDAIAVVRGGIPHAVASEEGPDLDQPHCRASPAEVDALVRGLARVVAAMPPGGPGLVTVSRSSSDDPDDTFTPPDMVDALQARVLDLLRARFPVRVIDATENPAEVLSGAERVM